MAHCGVAEPVPGVWESQGNQGPRTCCKMGWFIQEHLNNIRKRSYLMLANTYEENRWHDRAANAHKRTKFCSEKLSLPGA